MEHPITEQSVIDHWKQTPELVDQVVNEVRSYLCDPIYKYIDIPDDDEVREVLLVLADEVKTLRIQLGLS